jgi:hypothetical protein
LAIDGGTVLRKFLGVAVISNGLGWFWRMENVCRHDHQTALPLLTQVVKELMEPRPIPQPPATNGEVVVPQMKHCVVTGVVADNANGLQMALRQLSEAFKFICCYRCAAHTLQLVVKDVLAADANLWEFRAKATAFLRSIQPEQAKQFPKLPKPNVTRWSSEFLYWEALWKHRTQIESVIPSVSAEAWWHRVFFALNELKPFKIATDLFQSDSATMVTLMLSLRGLQLTVGKDTCTVLTRRILRGFASLPLLAAAFFAPNVVQLLPAPVIGQLSTFRRRFCQWAASWLVASKRRAELTEALESVEDQFDDFVKLTRREPQMTAAQQEVFVTELTYKRFWRTKSYECEDLANAVEAIVMLNPTEACCERMFSTVSQVLRARRNRLGDAGMEAQSFLKFNRRKYASVERSQPSGIDRLTACPPRQIVVFVQALLGADLDDIPAEEDVERVDVDEDEDEDDGDE